MKEILEAIDVENVFAILCLTVIAITAMVQSGTLPPVVNTVVGGIIGYLARSYTEAKKP